MKKITSYRERDRDLEIRMTPMIDVVFLLLVFFVWTASFHLLEDTLPTTLSAQLGQAKNQPEKLPPEIEFDEIVIRIFQQGPLVITLNGLPMADVGEFEQRLQKIAEIQRGSIVILHPESNVPLGEIINVFDVAQLAGVEKVQFATDFGASP